LQAASVVGRRFDAELLATVLNEGNVDDRLASMRALDLIHQNSKTADFEFKHALVRDALYNSLLSEGRTALHLKIADEIERCSGNRLTEVAEILAHHYSQTDHAKKAFFYLSMAGAKSLSVYSLDEATVHLDTGLALLDKEPNCASDEQVADFLVSYSTLLVLSTQVSKAIEVLERLSSYVNRLGDDPRVVRIRRNYLSALWDNCRYREAAIIQRENSLMAARLGDSTSNAFALFGEICVSTVISPKPLHEFDNLKKKQSRLPPTKKCTEGAQKRRGMLLTRLCRLAN
jgi:predicted ATPase